MIVICKWCQTGSREIPDEDYAPYSDYICRDCADLLLKQARKGVNQSTKSQSDKGPVDEST